MSAAQLAMVAGARPVAVAAYGRISRDRIGAGMGVARQLNAIDAYVTAHELGDVARSYTDNDLSGFTGAKPRPGYDALLADVRAGNVGTLIAWHVDRLTRQPAELETLMAACRESGTKLRTVTAGELDPTSPDGMLMARLTGAVASYESDHKRRRITMKHDELAQAGKFHGGRRRFGYEPGMSAIRESEAAAIREAVARVLGGDSLYSVAEWLNASGMATAEGNRWTGSNVGTMLRRPHLAGLRVHQGTITGEAEWAPIVTRADHERIVHKLTDPKRRTSYGNARVYLLANLATCYTCGAPLRGRPGTKANPDRRAYACATGRHCYRAVELVDGVVAERIVHRLETLTERGAIRLDHDGAADELGAAASELDALMGRRTSLADRWAAGELSDDDYDERRAALTKRIDAAEVLLTKLRTEAAAPVAVLDGMTGPGAGAAWEAADLGRRRAIVDTLAVVQLRGAATRRAPFDPADVELTWKIG